MTDRPHSCRQSPNGRHRFTVSPLMCDYCSRTVTYLVDMGWSNAVPADWKDEEADVNDAPRRAHWPEPECRTNGRWCCERQLGHSGQHMAWEDYDGGVLYPEGAWD